MNYLINGVEIPEELVKSPPENCYNCPLMRHEPINDLYKNFYVYICPVAERGIYNEEYAKSACICGCPLSQHMIDYYMLDQAYPTVYIRSSNQNIDIVLKLVREELEGNPHAADYDVIFDRVKGSNRFYDQLNIISEYVNLIDTSSNPVVRGNKEV